MSQLGTRTGLDYEAVRGSASEALSELGSVIAEVVGAPDADTYPAPDATIDTHLAAMDHLIHESELHGINTELPGLMKALAERAVASGQGGSGYAALIDQLRTSPSVA